MTVPKRSTSLVATFGDWWCAHLRKSHTAAFWSLAGWLLVHVTLNRLRTPVT